MSRCVCFVVVDHVVDEFFDDLLAGLHTFVPRADVVWFDSGADPGRAAPVPRLDCSRPLEYAKVTPAFLGILEWAAGSRYDLVVNVETDMAWVAPGFDAFLDRAMADADYLAPRLILGTPRTSRWRPYRSLRPELPELLDILGTDHTDAAFSPAQVFSARYANTVANIGLQAELRGFVERNQAPGRSFTLQEVLMPTLARVLGLRAQQYPPHMTAYNRYRPHHSLRSVLAAQARGDVHLVHPVRRDADHPARAHARSLVAGTRREGRAGCRSRFT